MKVSFVIPGRISGKGRPKFTTGPLRHVIEAALKSMRDRCAVLAQTGNDASSLAAAINELPLYEPGAKFDGNVAAYVHAYTPAETRDAESRIRTFGMAAMQGRPPMEGPLWIDIRSELNPPKSWSKRKRAETIYATGKPDNDNVEKMIGDALNGVCWTDDAEISANFYMRTYVLDGPECVRVSFGDFADSKIEVHRPDWAQQGTLPLFGAEIVQERSA